MPATKNGREFEGVKMEKKLIVCVPRSAGWQRSDEHDARHAAGTCLWI